MLACKNIFSGRTISPMAKKKPKNNPATLEEFRSLGGQERAKKLTKARRKQIATAAARARWAGK